MMSSFTRHWQRLDALLQRIDDRLLARAPWLLPILLRVAEFLEDGLGRGLRRWRTWDDALYDRLVRTTTSFGRVATRTAARVTDRAHVRTATVIPVVIVMLSASAIALAVVGAPTQTRGQLDALAARSDGEVPSPAGAGVPEPLNDEVPTASAPAASLTAEDTGPAADTQPDDGAADRPVADVSASTEVSGSDGPAGSTGTEDAGTAAVEHAPQADTPAAVLHVVAGGVDVVRGGTSLAAADGERIGPGDVVITDAAGVAELAYPDGSLTRIGTGSRFELETLATNPTRVRASLDVGSTWHRVQDLTRSGGSFEVETETGVAAVRGTAFAVLCTPGRCGVAVAEGRVDVRPAVVAATAVLRPGDSVRVTRARLDEVAPVSGDLATIVADNVVRDRAAGLPPPDPNRRGADDTGRPENVGRPDGTGKKPETPAKPEDAGNKPGKPAKPEDAGKKPGTPPKPGKPNEPGKKPETPAEPDHVRKPAPEEPEKPQEAGKPDMVGQPGDAGKPDAAGGSDTPGKPESLRKPEPRTATDPPRGRR